MLTSLEQIYQILSGVLPGKVTYGTNVVNDDQSDVLPFIVYQEISKRAVTYADNAAAIRIATFQINLVTTDKNPTLEALLEEALYLNGLEFQMITEYMNDDGSVNRVYEIKMEESTL